MPATRGPTAQWARSRKLAPVAQHSDHGHRTHCDVGRLAIGRLGILKARDSN